ncbi:hypothetical protein QIT38_gp06 [Methanocaldococcus fervens tailed virus 1]|uniref:Phage protein, HK97 gp10 family n=2 Tax=root TaxID=1 RepID=C7P5G8_METFA|nr:phage virion morphogenesis protein [Methanocaldococcus fervens]YP_010772301.1 hypothetical protein QIT38_gp06 [Methanocaldococcus fervens tailed virus 1]ACV25346.1 hypothetical protein Mefer_1543 [Methanocaldococcus fervens AG86]QNO11476.1 hypothetical protein [Methanocaldococcus fervens tailed virus 1]
MDYDEWIRKFKETVAHEIEKELTAEVDDNIRRGFEKKELKWKPLNEKYKKYKETHGWNTEGLMKHGHLVKATQSRIKVDRKGITVKVINNMEYAAVHEFGFSGTVNVKEHYRKKPKSKKGKKGKKGMTKKKDKNESNKVRVKAHTRNMNIPARPFIKPALEKVQKNLPKIIEKAIKKM